MTVTGPAITLQVRGHDKVLEPYSLECGCACPQRLSRVPLNFGGGPGSHQAASCSLSLHAALTFWSAATHLNGQAGSTAESLSRMLPGDRRVTLGGGTRRASGVVCGRIPMGWRPSRWPRGEAVGGECVEFGAGERPRRAGLRLAAAVVDCGDDQQGAAGRGQLRHAGRGLLPDGPGQCRGSACTVMISATRSKARSHGRGGCSRSAQHVADDAARVALPGGPDRGRGDVKGGDGEPEPGQEFGAGAEPAAGYDGPLSLGRPGGSAAPTR